MVGLGPVATCCLLDSFLKVAKESPDHVPLDGAANFNVTVLIDSHNRGCIDTGTIEISGMEFPVIDDLIKRCARHFNKFHIPFSAPLR